MFKGPHKVLKIAWRDSRNSSRLRKRWRTDAFQFLAGLNTETSDPGVRKVKRQTERCQLCEPKRRVAFPG